ncbi:MAG: hypothetical protein H0X29_01230 [Parachlamydiaceae bacterium]|nr:hypothetical protein [Parachlamydiaceae bacterium]
MTNSIPSAPSYNFYQQVQAQLAAEAAHKVQLAKQKIYAENHQKPNLQDDCCFCLDTLENLPEKGRSQGLVLAGTDCGHFFHEFCLKDFLESKNAPNKDCPTCRANIKDYNIVSIEVSSLPVQAPAEAPKAKPVAPSTIAPKEAIKASDNPANPVELTEEGNGFGNALYSMGGFVKKATTNAASVIAYLANIESYQTTKDRLDKIENKLVELNTIWASMPDMFQAQKNKMTLTLSSLRSLIESSRLNKEIVKISKETLKQVEILAKHSVHFQDSIDKAQQEFNDGLNKVQESASNIVK